MANPAIILISSQTIVATTDSVTFSSIPSTYNDLKLIVSASGDSAGSAAIGISIVFNSDTGVKYSVIRLSGSGTVASSSQLSNQTADPYMGMTGPTATTSTFGADEFYIPNYNSTANKPFFNMYALENNSATGAVLATHAHLYSGTSGISSITLTPSSGNFIANSNFYLYGIANS